MSLLFEEREGKTSFAQQKRSANKREPGKLYSSRFLGGQKKQERQLPQDEKEERIWLNFYGKTSLAFNKKPPEHAMHIVAVLTEGHYEGINPFV